ncbi:GntR family transcriptional regulator [Dactylosporangium darangshiense]|uniref:GntR family transcriptional regulator n=1 Tax=Dactylosporangium darangshiense TaxID=579108 RepID=UPI003626AC34
MPVGFRDIVGKLRQQIQDGRYPPGACLPSEAEMVKDFGCGRDTIRDAMAVLSNEGYILRRRGHLTIVRTRPAPTVLELSPDAQITARPITLTESDAIGCGPGIAMLEVTTPEAGTITYRGDEYVLITPPAR